MNKVSELKFFSPAELAAMGSICAWDGCQATFKGDMPRGWVYLITYWAKRPQLNILDVPQRDMPRDAVLCPKHAHALESQLMDLGRQINEPARGSA
jgi:hypothetical protein